MEIADDISRGPLLSFVGKQCNDILNAGAGIRRVTCREVAVNPAFQFLMPAKGVKGFELILERIGIQPMVFFMQGYARRLGVTGACFYREMEDAIFGAIKQKASIADLPNPLIQRFIELAQRED